jgi:hypothetical protein
MSYPKTKFCATCPYFVKRVNAPYPGVTFDGECHKNPPLFVYKSPTPYTRASSFVPVRTTDWCGEHPDYISITVKRP